MDIENKPGLYKITNLTNNKVYIGQSIKVKSRLQNHKRLLTKGMHPNKHLQNAWNETNGKFIFELLEYIDVCDLDAIEDKYILMYRSNMSEYGYNIRIDNKTNRGLKWSADQRDKFNQAVERNPWFHNHKVPLETAKKAWEASKNRVWTLEERLAQSKRLKGLKVLDTTKMKVAQTGSKNPSAKLNEDLIKEILFLNGDKKIKPTIISRIYNVSLGTILHIIKGLTWKHVSRDNIEDKFKKSANLKLNKYEEMKNE